MRQEKVLEAFARMTPEEREKAEEKRKLRAEKKLQNSSIPPVNIGETEKMNILKQKVVSLTEKSKALKELSSSISEIRHGKKVATQKLLEDMKKLLVIDDYNFLRDQYIDIIREAFYIRTVEVTHPVKTAAADFLNKIMSELRMVELGLILSLLTEGYISKTLARILKNNAELIIEATYGEFVLRFVSEIKNRNGNLNEDRSVSPFTPAQQKRVDELYEIYKGSTAQKTLDEWHNS